MKAFKASTCIEQIFTIGKFSASLALGLVLAGCATGLSKEECHTADWRGIGYEDGVQGRSESHISKHRKVCAKHGVAFNLDAYRDGWEEGVIRYCQPGNGYTQGRKGRQYMGVCPQEQDTEFQISYQQGREVYVLDVKVKRLVKTLNYKRKRLSDIEVKLRDTGIELVSSGITTEQRIILLDELRKLQEERIAIRDQIPELEIELETGKQRLSALDTGHQY